MHPAIPHLLELQRADQRIAALRSQLQSLPIRIREADAKLSGARQELASAKQAHTNSLTERKKLELDVEQWKERARKYRDQGAAIKTNEAFKALQHEIANAEAEVARAEDRLLEQMMAGEEIDRRIRTAEALLKDAERTVAEEHRLIEAEQAARQKELESALAEREAALAPVPEDLRELYSRIAKRHHGIVLAEARKEQCLACGMRVLPHIYQELRRESNHEVFHCETCGRILYFVEAAPVNTPAAAGKGASAAADSSA